MSNKLLPLAAAFLISVESASAQAPAQDYPALDQLRATYDPLRLDKGNDADWKYAMALASAGKQAWQIQASSGGEKARAAFNVRSKLFYQAARAVARWQVLYAPPLQAEKPVAPVYAYATMIEALFLKYSGDYWAAKKYLEFASNQMTDLDPHAAVPKYRGRFPQDIVKSERQEVDLILAKDSRDSSSSSYFGIPAESVTPYDRSQHFEMSNAGPQEEHNAAARYDLEHADRDPDLIGGSPPDIGADKPHQ